jgi:hypothetical protein
MRCRVRLLERSVDADGVLVRARSTGEELEIPDDVDPDAAEEELVRVLGGEGASVSVDVRERQRARRDRGDEAEIAVPGLEQVLHVGIEFLGDHALGTATDMALGALLDRIVYAVNGRRVERERMPFPEQALFDRSASLLQRAAITIGAPLVPTGAFGDADRIDVHARTVGLDASATHYHVWATSKGGYEIRRISSMQWRALVARLRAGA